MSAIKVGDLVMIVRGHRCTVERFVGVPFVVTGILPCYGSGYLCGACGTLFAGPDEPGATGLGKGGRAPLSWLIKINPPAQPESVEHGEWVSA